MSRRQGVGSPKEFTEGRLCDVYRLKYAEARASFIRRCGKPCLQVFLVAKEIHQRASHLSHAASVPVGGPDHERRRLGLTEQAALDSHVHRFLAEKARGPNVCLLAQHERGTQGIDGTHGIEHAPTLNEHLMCRWQP